ncbi:hypothetical protein TIFTF001_028524 [Ficus carica]|uniref:Uncharacterized protein n=1 Tax=Ficus carica TaxID=3494 RepID=A0AA88DRB1_FICCA|nr:hypothetical protein TIFTF001_028524 [Ficus carica]
MLDDCEQQVEPLQSSTNAKLEASTSGENAQIANLMRLDIRQEQVPGAGDKDIKAARNAHKSIQVPVGLVMMALAKRFKEELNNLVWRVL